MWDICLISLFSNKHALNMVYIKQFNLKDFLKFVGILLATQVLISLAGFLR